MSSYSLCEYDCDSFLGKFNWKGNIKAVLSATPDQELAIKKLRKKVSHGFLSSAGFLIVYFVKFS